MVIKKNSFYDFLWASFFAIISVVMYYAFYDIDNGTLLIAIISAIIRSLVLVFVLNKINKVCDNNYYTGAAYLLYSSAIYNSISAIKYSVDYLYTGAINNLLIRVLGSLYVDFVIIVATILFTKFHKRNVIKERGIKNSVDISIPTLLTYIILIVYLILNLNYTMANLTMLVAGVSRTMQTFVSALTYITYTAVILNIKKNKSGRFIISSLIPLVAVALANVYMTLITGKKSVIIVLAMIIICGLVYTKKISFSIAKFAAFSSPLALQVIQVFSESTSSRLFFTDLFKLQYHAFRFDLADLATTISVNFANTENSLGVIWESISYAIPSAVLVNKGTELLNYKNQIAAVGLNPEFDFNDTFFSMGAQAFGFLGILIIFVIIVLFFEWYSVKLLKIKSIGAILFLVLIGYFASCESDWSMFIYQTRDSVIILIISWVVFRLFTKIRNGAD